MDRTMKERMDERRDDVGQWDKDETAEMHTRMGNSEVEVGERLVEDQRVVKDDVDIHRTRGIAKRRGTTATQQMLDRESLTEEVDRSERSADDSSLIVERQRGIDLPRCSLIDRRGECNGTDMLLDEFQSLMEQLESIAQIAPKQESGGMRRSHLGIENQELVRYYVEDEDRRRWSIRQRG